MQCRGAGGCQQAPRAWVDSLRAASRQGLGESRRWHRHIPDHPRTSGTPWHPESRPWRGDSIATEISVSVAESIRLPTSTMAEKLARRRQQLLIADIPHFRRLLVILACVI